MGIFVSFGDKSKQKSPAKNMKYFSSDPVRLKEKAFFRNLEGIFIGNIELFCGNLRFLEKIALKLGHFAQKLQVLDQIVTVNWFNLIQNELFFLNLHISIWDIFKNDF